MCDHKVGSWKLNGCKLGVRVAGKTHGKLVPWGGEDSVIGETVHTHIVSACLFFETTFTWSYNSKRPNKMRS